jgi:hypothetical protein
VNGGKGRWPVALSGAVAAIATLSFAGCSPPGASLESAPAVEVTSVAAALADPVWSYRTDELVGLTADCRLAKISNPFSSRDAITRLSAPMSCGRNIQVSRKDDRRVLVPEPERGVVAVVDLDTLAKVDEFDAGPAPAYLSEDAGARILLSLSADGSSVTPVDEYGHNRLPTAKIAGDPAEVIDGVNRGRELAYHLYGPFGIRYYQGPSSPPAERGSLPMDVAVWAGDGADVTRSYVAGHNSDVLYAVDSRRGGQGLEVLAATRLPSAIRRLATDDTRIYAATDRELVTLQTASFTGFPDRTIPVLSVVDYRAALPDGPGRLAPVSGMAVGPHRVYLTLAGAEQVISVAKPHL